MIAPTVFSFSDSSFSQPTHNFSSGQTVYLRLETSGSGDQEKTLRLLDSAKKELRKIILDQSGQGPFVFTATFLAPNDPGVYYLDIKINSGQGFSLAVQENINIGAQDSQVTVTTEAEAVVESSTPEDGDEVKEPIFSPTPSSPPKSDVSLPEPKNPPSLIESLVIWVEKIIDRFFGFFGFGLLLTKQVSFSIL